jgi:hypothetical protein
MENLLIYNWIILFCKKYHMNIGLSAAQIVNGFTGSDINM